MSNFIYIILVSFIIYRLFYGYSVNLFKLNIDWDYFLKGLPHWKVVIINFFRKLPWKAFIGFISIIKFVDIIDFFEVLDQENIMILFFVSIFLLIFCIKGFFLWSTILINLIGALLF